MRGGVIEIVDTESLVPAAHQLRQIDGAVEYEKLYEIVEPLYSEERAALLFASHAAIARGK